MKTMLRIALTLVFCLTLLLYVAPTVCADGSIIATGECGKSLNWTLDSGGTLTITGSGKMIDYDEEHVYGERAPWKEYRDDIHAVELPAGLLRIGNYAFAYCRNLQAVTIPGSVAEIGNAVFYSCINLEKVIIPESVKIMEGRTFTSCPSLKSAGPIGSDCNIEFEWRETIPDNAFFTQDTASNYLETIIIPDGVISIGIRAFSGCEQLPNITIPSSVTNIGEYAFYNCMSLNEITIPYGVSVINKNTFGFCKSLKSVIIPGTVTNIEDNSFWACRYLKDISIPRSVTRIGNRAFYLCDNLKWIYIPKTLQQIEERAFENCNSLSDIYYSGSESDWNTLKPNIGDYNQPLLDATVHCNSNGPEDDYGYIINSGDRPWKTSLNMSFENIVYLTPSAEYNPALSYGLAGLSRAIYSESDIQESLLSLGFDYENAEKMFLDDSENYCSGYVVAKKEFSENNEDKTLVLIVIRGSVGYNNWNNLLNIGNSWTGSGQYPALKLDAETVHTALKRLFHGSIPSDSNTLYVITGHSQGAGAANILGTMLWYDGIPVSNIFDYTFACPNVACFLNASEWTWNPGGRYNYIYNIGNTDDIVPLIPNNWFLHLINPLVDGSSMWWKYGRSYWFVPEDGNRPGLNEFCIGHDMFYYVRHLSNLNPGSCFSTTDEIIERVSSAWWWVLVGHCPVDMTVYDKDGNPIAAVVNNQAEYYDSEFGQVMIFAEGDQKYFFLPPNQSYDVRITATSDGEMTYKVLDFNLASGDIAAEKDFTSITLVSGKTMTSSVDVDIATSDIKLYVVDENNNPISEVNEDGTESPIFTIHGSPYKKGSDAPPVYASNFEQVVYDFDSFALSSSPEETSLQKIAILDYHIQSISATDPSGNTISAEHSVYLEKSFLDTLPAGTYYLWGTIGTENTLIGNFAVEVADDVIATVNEVECTTVAEINAAVKDADDPVITVIPGRTIPVEQSNSQESDSGYVTIAPAPGYDFPEHESSSRLYISKDAVLDLNGGTVCGATVYASNLLIRDSSGGEGRATAPFILNDLIKVGGGSRLASLTVTGGSFVSDFNVSQYLAPGYAVENADGWDHVVPISYTISYDANGGNNAPETQEKMHGESLTLSEKTPYKSGWYFLGWAENPSAVDPDYPRPGGTFTRDANTVLYAVWAQPDLVLPSAVTEIGVEAFAGSIFRFAELPEHEVSIGSRAFADCPRLEYIYIYDKITDIAPDTFGNKEKLTIFGVEATQGVKSAAQVFAEEHGYRFVPISFRA